LPANCTVSMGIWKKKRKGAFMGVGIKRNVDLFGFGD
jgi:hypothetical protein